MREIKFRAWEKAANEYHYDVMYSSDCDQLIIFMSGELSCNLKCMTTKFIVEQYTGLKDINGKEIYEGDVVEGYNQKGEVWFSRGLFNVYGFQNSSFDYPTMAFSEGVDFQIIGNIHENKELIK